MAGPNMSLGSTTPTPLHKQRGKTGHKGAQTTGVEIEVYPLPDNGVTQPTNTVPAVYSSTSYDGRSEQDSTPSIVSCSVTNAIGSGGSFSVTVKAGSSKPLVGNLSDDSWIDISFTRNGKKWHVMRGLIDEVRVSQSLGGSGAYSVSFTIVGRSFQKVFANTPFYFNVNAGENLLGSALYKLMKTTNGVAPDGLIKLFLRDLPAAFGSFYNRGNWLMPRDMPNAQAARGVDSVAATFSDTFRFHLAEYDTYRLPRVVPSYNIANSGGGGDVWSMAQSYSDNMYNELFTEQMTFSDPTAGSGGGPVVDYDGTQGMDNTKTNMTVIFRDKPFISVDDSLNGDNTGRNSPFFRLPKFVIERQAIQTSDLGISGYERFNAFYSSSPIAQDKVSNTRFWQLPLWFPADIAQHGLRRMDITSVYSPDYTAMVNDKTLDLTVEKFARCRRALVRDWYCLGPQLLSGTLALGCGAPHLKIGCRLQVPSYSGVDPETNFYIEGLTHSWSAPAGTRTSITVTRGWIGDDASLLKAVQQMASNYEQGSYNAVEQTIGTDFTGGNTNVG